MRAKRLVSTPSVAATPLNRNTGAIDDWTRRAISIGLRLPYCGCSSCCCTIVQQGPISDRATHSAMKPSHLQPVEPAAPADADGVSLPAWIYRDAEFFERERDCIFRNSWQLVCHLSDVPRPGDFHTFEFYGESVLVLRAEDGAVRAFHNVCRHRAARLLDGPRGHCGRRITCPYHAWTYGLDGRLLGVPNRDGFTGLNPARHGLVPLEHEVFMGFI